MSGLVPKLIHQVPVPATLFNATADSLLSETARILQTAKALQDAIVTQITPETATFANTLLPLAHDENQRLYERQLIEFYGNVSPKEEIRNASHEAQRLFSQFDTETALRDDLYALAAAVRERGEDLSGEAKRLLDQVIRNFEQNGLALCKTDRARLTYIDAYLNQLKQQYLETCGQNVEDLWFTRDELDGLDKDIIDDLEPGKAAEEGKLKLTLEGFRYHEAMGSIKNQETRRRVYDARANNCKDNVPLLEEAIALRHEKAQLLGYSSFAELRMATMMEKSPIKIQNFLDNLLSRLSPERDARAERWRRLKHEDLVVRQEYDDGKFYVWDRAYYSNKAYKELHPGDDDHDKEYFALEETISRMLKIFETVMSIEFAEIIFENGVSPSHLKKGDLVWHEDVRMFAVWDASRHDGKPANFLGYLYMDMYSRQGKIPNFCDLPIRPAFTYPTGSRQYTSTCLVCNFDKPTKSKPSLLEHSQVVVLFHELGHAIHDLVAKTEYARFHGASTAGDFNEAPSQMLEEWCWYPPTLRMLSQHYSNPSSEYVCTQQRQEEHYTTDPDEPDTLGPLPEHRIERLIQRKRTYNVGKCLVLLDMALFDMAINSSTSLEAAKALDTTHLCHSIASGVLGIDMPHVLSPMHAASTDHFGDSGTYVYLTSQIYALDMFHSAFKADPMDREQGLRYRQNVIGRGSSEDEMKMLIDFLGRPPAPDALYEELGLIASDDG